MRFSRFFFLFSICFAFFFSCKSVPGDNRLYVNLTDNSSFSLLHTEDIGQNMDMVQYLSFEFREQNYFIIAWVKADENAIEMSFFNELGAGIGELSYTEGAVHFSSDVIPRVALRYIRPEYIIADFQLCFYEPVILGKALEESGLVLEIDNGNRRILNGNELIIEILKTDNSVKLTNHLRGYSYAMEGDFHGNE